MWTKGVGDVEEAVQCMEQCQKIVAQKFIYFQNSWRYLKISRAFGTNSTFAYDFRDQHIRIDKSDQVRFKSSKLEFDRFIC